MTPARYWRLLDSGKLVCELCPRRCELNDGQRGFCFVRARQGEQLVLTTYGRSSGFCVDPIEKKPLNHYHPGTSVLSFGTAGCNLACKFCQNWDISKSRHMERIADYASPEAIALAARQHGCHSVAYTYNDPVIFAEYAVDTASACRELGVESVAVTAGYMELEPAAWFFSHMDAANVDLKSFSETFYRKLTGGHLQPVLELLQYLACETQVWVELTTLLIPDCNDSEAELQALTQWVVTEMGSDVPIHFTAFHPDWQMRDLPRTPTETLLRARAIALANGMKFAYVGNVQDGHGGSTWCPGCGQLLIERYGYTLRQWALTPDGRCRVCAMPIPGRFAGAPGGWGARRLPVQIAPHL
ncbi:MAG: AmmeMemoRadiSam system radical SAM enzyme [Magnetococcales bacterium]|nr:AmmeMemoRadiSam system radical SAM enzyme [Magnetococcales bacterium]NGZ06631.1 AmmeMemoRadiSam system radical SAM enzyme [Magnetococcales bacterium]